MFNKKYFTKKFIIFALIVFIIFSAGVFIFISKTIKDIFIADEFGLKAPISEILDSNDFLGEDGKLMVQYAYRTKEKIETKENEVSRNNNSFTEYVGESESGKNHIYKLTTYSGANFAEKNGEWYQIEHATTTKEIFSRAIEPSFFAKLLGKKAWAETKTIYVGSGDGLVGYAPDNGSSWATIHDALTGNSFSFTGTQGAIAQSYENASGSSWYNIRRGFLPFDTSSIPVGSTINSATVSVYAVIVNDPDNDGDDWVNGSLGIVAYLDDNGIEVKLDEGGDRIKVPRQEWKHIKYI